MCFAAAAIVVACTGRWQYDNYNGCAVVTACCRYSCKGSFIEVYNEKIRDLLDTRSDDLKVSLLPLFTPLRRPAAPPPRRPAAPPPRRPAAPPPRRPAAPPPRIAACSAPPLCLLVKHAAKL